MFIALDANKNRISIENATKENQYFCPICGAPLTIRATDSLAVRTHFAHKRGTECLDNWTHDMSEWHLNWQQQFPVENREVVIEKNGVKHRADIFINNTVIEFQHSPITADEIAERNNFYLDCGYQVIWVFDATDKVKNTVGHSIDPMKCGENDLCWKRAKREFTAPTPPKVFTFVQYKTYISNSWRQTQEAEIMLLLKKNSPKNFSFIKTYRHMTRDNFLKGFGLLENHNIPSFIQIIISTINPQRPEQPKTAKKSIGINAWIAQNRPKRRWRL